MPSSDPRFDRLFAEHADAVRRYALRRLAEGADDVVAEVFLVVGDVSTMSPPTTRCRGCTRSPGGSAPTPAAASADGRRWSSGWPRSGR